ncbi:putative mitochondrial protein, partial [Tanacetum coccineum]
KNLEPHCDHLAQALQVMKDNTLYAKKSKCYFAIPQVEYLGHIIFAQDYGIISQPLVALTKKDAFKWNPSAELAYHQLKEAMVKAPVLVLPNFEQEFVVETDASGKGIGAVMLVAALDKWKGYLLDSHFKIRTYHFNLKYLLNQKLTTSFQFKWLPKLLGYDYEIVYKKGSENVAADALSRVDSSGELLQISISSISSSVWDKVKDSWKNNLETQNLIKSLEHHSYKGNKYSWNGKILKRKGKVVVGNDPELRKELVQHFHDEAIGGHSGAHVNMKKFGSLFYYKGLKKMVKQMVMDCDACQRQKPDLMDRLSKYGHFIPLAYPFSASQVAQVFLDQVYKLHGLPESIMSDRDKVFLSNFWKALLVELKVKLKLSTAYHPQTDGQTEVKWLPLAEFWYNTNYYTSTKTTPYEAIYCQIPPIHVPYIPGDSRVEEVDRTLQAREEAIKPHRQVSIWQGQQHKLSSKYYGPFKVAERIGELKKCHGKDHSMGVLPQLREDGLLENRPMAILERRLGKVNNKPVMFVLIQWTNKPLFLEDKESLRGMELIRAELEVNTARLKKLVLLAELVLCTCVVLNQTREVHVLFSSTDQEAALKEVPRIGPLATVVYTPRTVIDTSAPACATRGEAAVYTLLASGDRDSMVLKIINPAIGTFPSLLARRVVVVVEDGGESCDEEKLCDWRFYDEVYENSSVGEDIYDS